MRDYSKQRKWWKARAFRVVAFATGLIALSVLGYTVTISGSRLFGDDVPPVRSSAKLQKPEKKKSKTVRFPVPPALQQFESLKLFSEPIKLVPPHVVVDATTIVSTDHIIRLAFVAGLGHDDLCSNEDGLKFACGLRGRASIQNLIWNSEFTCRPVFYPADQVRYACLTGDIDLAAHQVAAGYARADAYGRFVYESEQQDAAIDKKGAWDGGWMVVLERPKAAALPKKKTPKSNTSDKE